MNRHLTAIVEREGDSYVALCPEVDIARGLIYLITQRAIQVPLSQRHA